VTASHGYRNKHATALVTASVSALEGGDSLVSFGRKGKSVTLVLRSVDDFTQACFGAPGCVEQAALVCRTRTDRLRRNPTV